MGVNDLKRLDWNVPWIGSTGVGLGTTAGFCE